MPITLTLPSLYKSVAYILASGAGIVATWYIMKRLVPWVQAYRNKREELDSSDARIQTAKDTQKANLESDKLKEIDGR